MLNVHLMRYSIHVLEQPGNVWYPCTKVLVEQVFQSVVNMDVGRLPLSWRCAHLQLSNAMFYVSLLFLQEVYKLKGIRASSSEFFIADVVISFTDIVVRFICSKQFQSGRWNRALDQRTCDACTGSWHHTPPRTPQRSERRRLEPEAPDLCVLGVSGPSPSFCEPTCEFPGGIGIVSHL